MPYIRLRKISSMAGQNVTEEGGLDILKYEPYQYREALCELRECHDIFDVHDSRRDTILGPKVKGKIKQCSVDFSHVSIQTAVQFSRENRIKLVQHLHYIFRKHQKRSV